MEKEDPGEKDRQGRSNRKRYCRWGKEGRDPEQQTGDVSIEMLIIWEEIEK